MILILGYGLIGKSLYERLTKEGYDVNVISRTVPQNHKDFISADITAINTFNKYFEQAHTVIHCLHTTVPATSNFDEVYDVQSNLIPFVSILNICKESKVENFVFISSGGAVYGLPTTTGLVNELSPTNPLSSYGITKLACEKYLQLYREIFKGNVSILRPSNIYGRNQKTTKPNGIIGHAISACINYQVLKIWGSGNGVKDYLYVEDFVDAVLLLLEHKGRSNQLIYNIASGYHLTINEIVNKTEQHFNRKITREYLSRKNFDVETIIIDSALFKHDFSWKPRYSLDLFLNEYK
jgi:UDP-glucose 4-epimerase